MKDTITRRVARIIGSGFHALVEAVENRAPEAVMDQALREIEDAMEEIRDELGKTIALKYHAQKRLSSQNSHHEKLSESIELAVKEKKDHLAEAAIEEQLNIEAQIPVLERTMVELAEKEAELSSYIGALQAKKREMALELKEIKNTRISLNPSIEESDQARNISAEKKANRAVSVFNRLSEKVTGIDGSPMDPKNAIKLNELDELQQSHRIKERLSSIKAGLTR